MTLSAHRTRRDSNPRSSGRPGSRPSPAQRLQRPLRNRGLALLLAAAAVETVAVLGAGAARASSPEAWNRYDRQVRSACVAASGLAAVRVRGARIDLPSLGLSTLLLEGTYPQAHMRGQQGLELCVFEQRSGRAAVAEADGWRNAAAAATGSQPTGSASPQRPAGAPAMPTPR